ncbi:MAG: hypothetical protein U5K56_00330 [Halioglobus sp.]|nr:hypothetical protein [Halioglobus sp.]
MSNFVSAAAGCVRQTDMLLAPSLFAIPQNYFEVTLMFFTPQFDCEPINDNFPEDQT